jgi:hypothetical protein
MESVFEAAKEWLLPEELKERIAALVAETDLLVDYHGQVRAFLVPRVAATFLIVTFIYYAAFLMDGKTDHRADLTRKRKRCYQITNFCVNAVLGCMGVYYECYRAPKEVETFEETITGHYDFAIFSAIQFGYQFWAIPVGLFWVGENLPMLLHHFAVINVSCLSAFFVNGFRTRTAFFYGVVELSSVPLAIINSFKDQPELIGRHPAFYGNTRLLFAALFLYLRVWLFAPRGYRIARDVALVAFYSGGPWFRVWMGTVVACIVFLLALQLHWGRIIVATLLKLFFGGGGGDAKKKSKTVVMNGAEQKVTTRRTTKKME